MSFTSRLRKVRGKTRSRRSHALMFPINRTKLITLLTLVQASVPSNTFAIYGVGEDKELTELVPGILNQLGPDSLASLRKLAESYQSMQKKEGGGEDGEKKADCLEGGRGAYSYAFFGFSKTKIM